MFGQIFQTQSYNWLVYAFESKLFLFLNFLKLFKKNFLSDNAKAVRSDAAAELDRLTRGAQKKPSGSGHNSMDNSLNNSSSEC